LAQIVDFACNLVRILDCDFIVELLADPNLDKIVSLSDRQILLQIFTDLYTPIPPPCFKLYFKTRSKLRFGLYQGLGCASRMAIEPRFRVCDIS
jgi:hypothetical protein